MNPFVLLKVAAFEKVAKSRWAEEMARLVRAAQKAHEAGNAQQARALIEQAQHIGETVGKAGTKLREVMPLGEGAEAVTKLMAGDLVHRQGAGGMAAMKFLDPARGVRVKHLYDDPISGRDAALKKFHDYSLPQRKLESTLDPELVAKSHGMFRRAGASSGDVDAMRSGGVELQEFLPFEANRPQTDAVDKAFDDSAYFAAAKKQYIDNSGRPFGLGDINDRVGMSSNVRLDVSGKPKAVDLRFNPVMSGVSMGNISREEGHEGAHASKVLRELREGTAERVERLAPQESLGDKIKRILAVPKQPVLSTEVPKPSKPSHALRNAAIAAGIGVPVVAGGAALAHHIYKKNKQEDGMPKAATANSFFDEMLKPPNSAAPSSNGNTALAAAGAGVLGTGVAMSKDPIHDRLRDVSTAAQSEEFVEDGVNRFSSLKNSVYDALKNKSSTPIEESKDYGLNSTYDPRLKNIAISAEHQGVPSVLAHELGHAHIDKSLGGRLLQGFSPTKLHDNILSPAFGVSAGASIDNPYLGAALSVGFPLLLHAPNAASEVMASMNGVKSMRAAGASPEMLQQAKRGLTAAFGTYAANAASAAGKGLAGWGAGRLGREGYEAAFRQGEDRHKGFVTKAATANSFFDEMLKLSKFDEVRG